MIGGLVLRECLQRADVQQVIHVGRRSVGVKHPKLVEVSQADLSDTSAITAHLSQVDVCFFCLGVYTGALPPAAFQQVMTEMPVAFCTALKAVSPNATVCFLSGDGADRTEKSRFLFARARGAAERRISELGFPRFHAFRPGYIYPVERRKEPNAGYRTMRALWKPLLSWLAPGMGLTSHQLAHAMVLVGSGQAAPEIIDNNSIKRIAERIAA